MQMNLIFFFISVTMKALNQFYKTIVDQPTHVPDTMDHHTNLLDPFFTSYSEKSPGNFYLPITVKVNTKPKVSLDVPFHQIIFKCAKADWNNFRSYFVEALLSSNIEIPELPSSFLNGSSWEWTVLSLRNNINRKQIASFGPH